MINYNNFLISYIHFLILISHKTVPPSSIQILDESGNLILNSTTLGPLRENHRFTSICEIRGTRPAPLVGWYRAGKKLQGIVFSFYSRAA